MPYDYDLVVLGCGPAGEKGAVQAAYFGKRVACVEMAPEPGGAAVHTGTLPSKTLRETALFLSGFRQRELYGIDVSVNKAIAVPKLLSRKDAVRGLEVERIKMNLERHGVPLFIGAARFSRPHEVTITSRGEARAITASVVLVATGSEPFHPPNIPFEDDDIDDSDTILNLDRLPRTMVVLGGGVIGCEYACMFAALRVKVTLVEGRSKLLPFLDAEMGERLQIAMEKLGVTFRFDASVTKAERVPDEDGEADGGSIDLTLQDGAVIRSDKLLVASGRSGRSRDLGLDAVGVTPDKRGYVPVDADYKTSADGVYAAGDVIGFPALASTSMEQARVAVCHAFGFAYKKSVSTVLPYGVYTIPEVSCVGHSEEELQKAGTAYVVGRAFYRDNPRAKILGDNDGIIKLLFDRASRKLLGCHCIGERASELVHLGQEALLLGGTVDTFIEMVFNYPTLSEAFKYAAYDALRGFQTL